MKRFVDELTIRDYNLAKDIIHALETTPVSNTKYEIEMCVSPDFDPSRNVRSDREAFHIKIFSVESMK